VEVPEVALVAPRAALISAAVECANSVRAIARSGDGRALSVGHGPVAVQGTRGADGHRATRQLHVRSGALCDVPADRGLDCRSLCDIQGNPERQLPEVVWRGGSDGEPDLRNLAWAGEIGEDERFAANYVPRIPVSAGRIGAGSAIRTRDRISVKFLT